MRKDGGQAFPTDTLDGMTLRDYFAGQALASPTVGWNNQPGSYEDCTGGIASAAYGIADAMIKERIKQ